MLTRGRIIIGFLIIVAGIVLIAVGSALVSQTPDPSTGAKDSLEGFAEWATNVGIEAAKILGTGLFYLGIGVIISGIVLIGIWTIR